MAKTLIDLDEEALAFAAEALGTKTKKDTVNAALREIGARVRREQALEAMIALYEAGAFDESMKPGYKAEVNRREGGVEGWSAERKAS